LSEKFVRIPYFPHAFRPFRGAIQVENTMSKPERDRVSQPSGKK
jgi:hypothetical protein